MPVSKDEIKHIAKLVKLNLSDEEMNRYEKDINEIIDYINKLNELDTTDVKPLNYPLEKETAFREDVVGKSLSREATFKNAPDTDGEFFKVPKIIKNR